MGQDNRFWETAPKARWPRRQPHGNHHGEWRSRRDRRSRTSTSDDHEAECQKAIAAFLDEQSKLDDTPR